MKQENLNVNNTRKSVVQELTVTQQTHMIKRHVSTADLLKELKPSSSPGQIQAITTTDQLAEPELEEEAQLDKQFSLESIDVESPRPHQDVQHQRHPFAFFLND
jgi:hypothetical protein